jgi:hypothetical protein
MILLEEFYFLMDEEVIIYECTKGHCHKTSINVRLLRLDSFMFFFCVSICSSEFILYIF